MAKISCLLDLLFGKTKKSKDTKVSYARRVNGNDCPKVKPVEFVDGGDIACVGKCGDGSPARDTEVVAESTAAEYARGDRYKDDDMVRGLSAVDLVGVTGCSSGRSSDVADKDTISAASDVSVSGAGQTAQSGLLRLERSCSNIETARPGSRASDLLPEKSRSHDDLMALPSRSLTSPNGAPDSNPAASEKTTFSADRVMLKRRSSSQMLPSLSRKIWWRMFLWSHRNVHRADSAVPMLPSADTDEMPRQHDGYTSDTHDRCTAAANAKNKEIAVEEAEPIPNQWVAFSAEASSLDRVSTWVSSLGHGLSHVEDDIMEEDDGAVRLPYTEIGESSSSGAKARRRCMMADEAIQASSIVKTLNASSSVAHISGMGLKVLPMISTFSSLRTVNLSSNLIALISPGSLPKGLHSLDLSRNRIASIEGLREMTRLRVLNLSYNRISHIGHGLSNCTAIRELYLAGNKIRNVEGLHRLLKLTVLDLSFNKIATVRDLAQLVGNYNSLGALNLLGNKVQTNVGDDALCKAVLGLLPRLEYLNKQAVKRQRARGVSRRLTQSPGSSIKKQRISYSVSGSRSRASHILTTRRGVT